MPFNATEEDRQRQVARDLAEKIRLEQPVAREVRQLLREISDDLEASYAANATIPDAVDYLDEVSGILRQAYRRTSREFGSDITTYLEENEGDEEDDDLVAAFLLSATAAGLSYPEKIDQLTNRVRAGINGFITDTVRRKARLITETNQSELERSVTAAVAAAAAADEPLGRRDVARMAGQNFRDSSLYRGALIAQTEVQEAAEGAKSVESQVAEEDLRALRGRGESTLTGVKEWHTVGDDRVREAHVIADFQTQPFDSPFTVDGELLMNPGDTNLGASAGNVINCRCSAVYYFEGSVVRTVTADSDTGFGFVE